MLDWKKNSVFMDVFRYKPFTGPKISASQRTMIAIFPKKGKKNIFPRLRFKRTNNLFHFMVLLLGLLRSSYCVVFNILTLQNNDLTDNQSLTGQNVRKRSQINFEFCHPCGPRDLQPETLHQGFLIIIGVRSVMQGKMNIKQFFLTGQ